MKYILIAYIAFSGSWSSYNWQLLEPRVFPNHETCSRYMDELADDLKFHRKHGQNGVKDWNMTCRHYFETDADHKAWLKSINAQ